MVVVVILALLIAFLLPALNSSIRTARNASVQAEINQLAAAIAQFKTQYGDYLPSRIYLAENGDYSGATSVAPVGSLVNGTIDISQGQLVQRSLSYLRKIFPRVILSTSGAVFAANSPRFYDFNGNGVMDSGYILQGHECLVFFLGGIPNPNPLPIGGAIPTSFSMTGFGKDPTNPFSNSIASDPRKSGAQNSMYGANRSAPLFEFAPNRLVLDPNGLSGIPGYLDSLGNQAPPPPTPGTPQQVDQMNFYAYFSAYGNGGYDPNDVNFTESHPLGNNTQPLLTFTTSFKTVGNTTLCVSPPPNPYTSALTVPGTGVPAFINAQTFQLFSPGADGQYGVGGQYLQNATGESLPLDTANTQSVDTNVRTTEKDNLTNFHNGRLE
jgi:general secretion pathway protein G